jgi:hypothetical protein
MNRGSNGDGVNEEGSVYGKVSAGIVCCLAVKPAMETFECA